MPFQKGVSGNPKGRPPASQEELKRLCQLAAPQAVAALVAALDDPQRAVSAAAILLDRAYGRAPQAVAITGEMHVTGGIDAPTRPYTVDEAEAWLAHRRAQLAKPH